DLVAELRAIEESPWKHFEFTQNDLAGRLRPYGVRPEQVRPKGRDGKQVRGYRLERLLDVFARYLSSQGVTTSQPQVSPPTVELVVTPETVTTPATDTATTRTGDAVTVGDAPTPDPY